MSKMKISEIIENAKENFGIVEIISDNEFDTLGLAVSSVNMSFCTFIDDVKYIESLKDNATMVITSYKVSDLIANRGVCISENPRITFFKIHNYLAKSDKDYRLDEEFDTIIGENCKISDKAYIASKNVKIGNNVIIEEFVSIKENTIIGDNTFIGAGSVIGGEGYEFKRLKNSEVLTVKHIGWTKIGKNVDIQYNTCIDKAIYPWDATVIGDYCKIDNLVHIAHGVKLGKAVFVVAGALIGGRTVIKDNTWIGVGATVSNGLTVGKDARVNIGAVATKNVDDYSSVSGNFAIDHNKFIEFIKSIR